MDYTNFEKICDICLKRQTKKKDTVIIVCGYEGVGKTTWTKHFYELYLKKVGREELKATHFCIPLKKFAACLFTSQKKDIVVWDEAGDASGKNAMTTLNKKLVKLYKKIRAKQLVTVMNLPDFFDIDSYFRLHRTTLLIFVCKTGKYYVFNKKKIKEIITKGEKTKSIDNKLVKPCAIGYYPDYTGDLFPDYDSDKDTVMDDEAKEFMEFFEEEEELLRGIEKVAKYCRVSRNFIELHKEEIGYIKNAAGSYLFKKVDVDLWLDRKAKEVEQRSLTHAVEYTLKPKVNL